MSSEHAVPNISAIKNKQRRTEAFKALKKEKNKVKKEAKKEIRKQRKLLGEEAVPKGIPKTIENTRIYDETLITGSDEEVMKDEETDELGKHIATQHSVAKVLITTTDRPSSRTNKFCKELKKSIPFSEIKYRRGLELKKISVQASARGYTGLIVINEDQKVPNGMIISHLPDGPTAHFRLSKVVFAKEIKRSGELTDHLPELILNNFSTSIGRTVGRLFANLYPTDPDYHGRRVVTFHNQRDYIFFRQHRYQFRNAKRVGLHELGPRFTLKLRSLQRGTFDSKHGEFEWVQQREKDRKKFVL